MRSRADPTQHHEGNQPEIGAYVVAQVGGRSSVRPSFTWSQAAHRALTPRNDLRPTATASIRPDNRGLLACFLTEVVITVMFLFIIMAQHMEVRRWVLPPKRLGSDAYSLDQHSGDWSGRVNKFKTVAGDSADGEWAQSRVLQVQFHDIKGNDVEQFAPWEPGLCSRLSNTFRRAWSTHSKRLDEEKAGHIGWRASG
jgi:glycerol uptake facilitator-like aquaporin